MPARLDKDIDLQRNSAAMRAAVAAQSPDRAGVGAAQPPLVHGRRATAIRLQRWCRALRIAIDEYRSPVRAVRAVLALKHLRAHALRRGVRLHGKYVEAGGRYFSGLYEPGWPSPAFDRSTALSLARVVPEPGDRPAPQTVLLAITKRCPLSCEHCFEWDAINRSETLSLDALKTIVCRFQRRGAAQIQLSGGEPLARFADLTELVRTASPGTDFWVITSGFGLDRERAIALRSSGFTGVIVSIDHVDPSRHDEFRGMKGSFDRAIAAVAHARQAGLVVALSLCATRAFVTGDNLTRYARMAGEMGVGFIQLLEPRATGRYAGHDVALDDHQLRLLEDFTTRLNHDDEYHDMPIVEYASLAQRRLGCFGAGQRYLYVDTDGGVHACPFCRMSIGNAVDGDLDRILLGLAARGCEVFSSADLTAAGEAQPG